ncbi:hypothetical protein MNB_SV-5-176 [hydrothermal vent metagenome]|uniref:Uncharacterized protein n=1 Tax=hydrothermal vent metagenome TaxID=652676 RepID=A0A1W1ECP0_9ZZZZ
MFCLDNIRYTLKNNKDLQSCNSSIIKSISDVYTQGEVEKYLNISAVMVSHVFRYQNH